MAAAWSPISALFIAGNATVIGDVVIDEGSSVWYGAVIRGDRDAIRIGKGSNIQDNAVIHTSEGHPVSIGDDVSIGHGAILHGCSVSDQVLIGMGSILMNGSRVGEQSIIGAGAVVTEGTQIPPRSLVLGVPGRVIRAVSPEEGNGILTNAQVYRNLAERYARGA